MEFPDFKNIQFIKKDNRYIISNDDYKIIQQIFINYVKLQDIYIKYEKQRICRLENAKKYYHKHKEEINNKNKEYIANYHKNYYKTEWGKQKHSEHNKKYREKKKLERANLEE